MPSSLEQIAYELIEARITAGMDDEEERVWESYTPGTRERYLRHQANSLAELWRLLADNFSPDPIAEWSQHHES